MIQFSVLMAVYKKEKPSYLEESLASIFFQTLSADEVILIKDGPLTEDLENVINKFQVTQPTLKIIQLNQNQGLGNALNVGMKHCSYDYIARMDSDDICFPNRFELQIAYIENHPDIDVVGSWTQEFYEKRQGTKVITSLKKFPHKAWDNFKYCTKRCPVEHPAVIFKKVSVLEAGGYQHCYLFEDYHLWARMFVDGAKFYNLQEPLLYFRTSRESYSRRGGIKYAKNEYNVLKQFKQIGFLSKYEFIYAVITRFPVRIIPNFIRTYIYKIFLRK